MARQPIQQYRGTAASFSSENPLLLKGELAIVFDDAGNVTELRAGDGVRRFNSLSPLSFGDTFDPTELQSQIDDATETATDASTAAEAAASAVASKADAKAFIALTGSMTLTGATHAFHPMTWTGSADGTLTFGAGSEGDYVGFFNISTHTATMASVTAASGYQLTAPAGTFGSATYSGGSWKSLVQSVSSGSFAALSGAPSDNAALAAALAAAAAGSSGAVLSVTGTRTVGQTLTAAFVSGYAGTLQWFWRGGADISGATSSTYVQVSGDTGHYVDCRATSLVYSALAGATTGAVADTTKPTITSAVIASGDATHIVWTASETLSAWPAAGDITLGSAGGKTITAVSHTSTTFTGTVSAAFAYGDTPTYSIAANKFYDAATTPNGNAAITAASITNNIAAASGGSIALTGTLGGALTVNFPGTVGETDWLTTRHGHHKISGGVIGIDFVNCSYTTIGTLLTINELGTDSSAGTDGSETEGFGVVAANATNPAAPAGLYSLFTADTTLRKARIYAFAYGSGGGGGTETGNPVVTATLSDGSATPVTQQFTNDGSFVFEIDYKAASSGQTLRVDTLMPAGKGGFAVVGLAQGL